MNSIGFGGSCHWCTEAIFQSLNGVTEVLQGWIASEGDASDLSEAVTVKYDPAIISFETLIAVHLHTHSCTAEHSMRSKYRSAIYTFYDEQVMPAVNAIKNLQQEFEQKIVTTVLPFKEFKLNKNEYLNYYYSNPAKLFCQNIVNPKLQSLIKRFSREVKPELLSKGL
jgi:peptide-methionine (S)-S-oxide reductase